MCTRPSLPGRISTNAPKSMMRFTGPVYGLADDRLFDEAFHHPLRLLRAFLQVVVDRDRSAVIDVDRGARLLAHALDVLAARADDQPDLLRRNLDGDDLGREVGDVVARLRNRLVHDSQDVQPAFACLAERLLEDLRAHPFDLDVHLQGGDPVLGSRHLEIHVTQVVFLAEDVAQNDELVPFLDEPHRDSRDGFLDAHARVQQAQRAAADGCHGGGAVGFEDLRDDADRIGEVLLLGRTMLMALSARWPWPISRRPGEPSRPTSPTEKGGKL